MNLTSKKPKNNEDIQKYLLKTYFLDAENSFISAILFSEAWMSLCTPEGLWPENF
jgi:hypothetical protein